MPRLGRNIFEATLFFVYGTKFVSLHRKVYNIVYAKKIWPGGDGGGGGGRPGSPSPPIGGKKVNNLGIKSHLVYGTYVCAPETGGGLVAWVGGGGGGMGDGGKGTRNSRKSN